MNQRNSKRLNLKFWTQRNKFLKKNGRLQGKSLSSSFFPFTISPQLLFTEYILSSTVRFFSSFHHFSRRPSFQKKHLLLRRAYVLCLHLRIVLVYTFSVSLVRPMTETTRLRIVQDIAALEQRLSSLRSCTRPCSCRASLGPEVSRSSVDEPVCPEEWIKAHEHHWLQNFRLLLFSPSADIFRAVWRLRASVYVGGDAEEPVAEGGDERAGSDGEAARPSKRDQVLRHAKRAILSWTQTTWINT